MLCLFLVFIRWISVFPLYELRGCYATRLCVETIWTLPPVFFFESSLISIKLELGFGGIIFFFALFSLFLFFLNGDNHWPNGHASTVLRDAPPGQEVGLIVARRTGRLRRQVAATAIKTDKAWRVFFF